MAFVIAAPCIDHQDQECIAVCPVDCIALDPGDRKAYIDSRGMHRVRLVRVSACPQGAIYAAGELPAPWVFFAEVDPRMVHRPGLGARRGRRARGMNASILAAGPRSAKYKTLDENNTFEPEGGPRLLTSAAVYGANASGKSNLVRAIGFIREFVLTSPKGTQPTGGIDVEPFRLSTTTVGRPSHFEIVFIAEGKRYRYGFEATAERVEREWLFHVPRSTRGAAIERAGDAIQLGEGFREEGIAGRTRPNALFLSVVAQFNGKIAQRIVSWFLRLGMASGLLDIGMRMFTRKKLLRWRVAK